jgi:hypothetical protein
MLQPLLFVYKSKDKDLKKAKDRTWDSASLRTKTLRVMNMQFLAASLRAQTLREIMLKNS